MAQTAKQILARYRRFYEVLAPSKTSVHKASELWDVWETQDLTRPDLSAISSNVSSIEEGFFKELSEIASTIIGKPLVTHYCPFRTSQYNFSAFTASDGYIVLVDEAFFQFLFLLCITLFHHTFSNIDAATIEAVKSEFKNIITTCYFNRQGYSFDNSTAFHELMSSSYETTELANYFFQSIKAFIIGHELGHHALGHTQGSLIQKFAIGGQSVDISIDKREWQDEYFADAFGYQVYLAAADSKSTAQYTQFLYRIDFAPVFFFEICALLDGLEHSSNDTAISPELLSHPPLSLRQARLAEQFTPFKTDDDQQMYQDLLASLQEIWPVNSE